MAYSEQRHDFTGMSVYKAEATAGAVFPFPAAAAALCLGVFHTSGGSTITGSNGNIPCGAVDIFTPWTAGSIDATCEVGPGGAEWFCFTCDNPQSKTTEQVDIAGSYSLPGQTQAIVVAGALSTEGGTYGPLSQMLFESDTTVSGTGTLILVR
jgi:hypothetical protein